MSSKILLLIDHNQLLRRHHHAHGEDWKSGAYPMGGAYGVLKTVGREISRWGATHACCVFECEGESSRKQKFPGYKAGRPPEPFGLKEQRDRLFEWLPRMGYPCLRHPGAEADDVLVTLAVSARYAGFDQVIVETLDRDLATHAHLYTLWNPRSREVMTPARVAEKYGVLPRQIPDLLALMGSSGAGGIDGIGEKKAAALLREFGSIEGIVANGREVPEKMRLPILASRDRILGAREFLRLDARLSLGIDLESLMVRAPEREVLTEEWAGMGLDGWSREIL